MLQVHLVIQDCGFLIDFMLTGSVPDVSGVLNSLSIIVLLLLINKNGFKLVRCHVDFVFSLSLSLSFVFSLSLL